MQTADAQLLAKFNACRSDEAFAALVRRHVDLVFATAVRLVADHAIAEDITQSVFVTLAQSAGKLGRRPTLAGWLYQTTVNKSRERLRSELRRVRREKIALSLQAVRAEGDSVWLALVPLLDEALLELRESDRLAILLHFMEGQSFRQVGQLLGVGEDAARKRVGRCLSQLTAFFRQRGFAVPALAASAPLFTLSMQAAPLSLPATVITASLAAPPAVAAGIGLTTTNLIAMTKLKTVLAGALVVAGVTTPFVFQRQALHRLRQENVELRQLAAEASEVRTRQNQLTEYAAQTESPDPLSEEQRLELVRLRGEVGRLRQQTHELEILRQENQRLRAAADPGADDLDSSFVRVNKADLPRINFTALDRGFELTSLARSLLRLTPDETERLETYLDALKERVRAHDLQHLRSVDVGEVNDLAIVRFFEGKEGEKTVYSVSPFSDQAKADVKDWFFGGVSEIIGEKRRELFEKNAKEALDFWLGGTEDKLIAFIDRFDDEGQPVDHEFMVKFNTLSSHGTMSGSLNQPVPQMFKYLFQAANNHSSTK